MSNVFPFTDFLLKYKIEKRESSLHNYIDTSKVIRDVNCIFYNNITQGDNSYDDNYFDFDETYIM